MVAGSVVPLGLFVLRLSWKRGRHGQRGTVEPVRKFEARNLDNSELYEIVNRKASTPKIERRASFAGFQGPFEFPEGLNGVPLPMPPMPPNRNNSTGTCGASATRALCSGGGGGGIHRGESLENVSFY